MNKIKAKVTKVEKIDSLHIVSFDFDGILLKMMSLELSEKIQIDTSVILAVKPTHVTFAKNFQGYISITNQFRARIK